jgi:UDP-3-O-[3-hydroxymyristoyl] glucosamine N-acyltransferase
MAERPSYTTAQLADLVGGTLNGPGELLITGINSMAEATEEQVTFIASPRYAGEWNRTRAGAALITRGLAAKDHDPSRRALIEVDNAELAAATVLEALMPPAELPDVGIHPTAFVHPEAQIAATARIGPHVTIDRGAVIGEQVALCPACASIPKHEIGDQTSSTPTPSFASAAGSARESSFTRMSRSALTASGTGRPQSVWVWSKCRILGTVIIEDDVEIGAGSCMDRAKFGATTDRPRHEDRQPGADRPQLPHRPVLRHRRPGGSGRLGEGRATGCRSGHRPALPMGYGRRGAKNRRPRRGSCGMSPG